MATRIANQLGRVCARIEADTLLRDQLIRQMKDAEHASLADIRAATGQRLSRSGVAKILGREPEKEPEVA